MKNVLVLFSSRSKRHSSADGFAGPLSSGDSTAGRASSVVKQEVARLKAAEEARKAREERLAKLNPFCLDATIVECLSAGQESVEDKVNAFKLLSQCGLKNIVLAAFVKEKTPDLKFLQASFSLGRVCKAFP
ncbi:hypothetical protein VOLCADRAFT_119825 [Volvox carteri f. nagariensis]|uniref:Uncharacterized protein n=1 Tax=Volvox carteri f. nagariensis TaxID=3068 RepID=D8UH98_VOLCA|nr:uncharacterized protein VOLCADRAFT_119825 [Volvox carteri f. nagariensis]EFJ40894.1 hypothetical protein VOLCADRAFT_119825 [Volvox carteri f. nagariensis]|eukprot:XP_002958054.1 hypothetical protein VOLCADRAFT_119825 [Volvox carteri f. nagariensis]